MSKSRSDQRQKLFLQQKGKCYWCPTMMTPALGPRTRTDPPYPLTMCTLDHVVDRLDPRRRQKPRSDEVRRVAACLKCNRERSVTAQRNYYSSRRKEQFACSGV